MLLPAEYNATEIHIVNDLYWKISTRNDTRHARGDGEESCRVHLKGIDQKMLRGTDWGEFFHNGENNEDVIIMLIFKKRWWEESCENTIDGEL